VGDGLRITWTTDPADSGGLSFRVRSDAPTIAGPISVETRDGVKVGDLTKDVVAANPGAKVYDDPQYGT